MFCGAKYRGGARRAEGFKSSHIQVFNLFFFNPSPRDESPSEPPLYRYPTQGRSVDATLFPGFVNSKRIGKKKIVSHRDEERVTQKSKTFKGHPFLFGLRQMVTMRE